MKITRAQFVPIRSAFYFDDQRAIKQGAGHDGFMYRGDPVTPGFRRVREAGEAVSVLITLDTGAVAVGDCAAVQYSGAGGRDPLFRGEDYARLLQTHVGPWLQSLSLSSFTDAARALEDLRVDGERLHTAIRYGVSQALLEAVAQSSQRMMCQVLSDEHGVPLMVEPIPIFGQSGDSRYENAEKMLIKQVDVLPHGLINSVEEKLGRDGGMLREYIRWLVRRVGELRLHDGYRPTLHLDVYGTIGQAFDHDPSRIADYLTTLKEDAGELLLYIEGPVDMEGKEAQIAFLADLVERMDSRGTPVKIVADEWCNTLEDIRDFVDARACHMAQIKTPDLGGIDNTFEAVRYCREHGVEAYQGGTCNETDMSARCCVHVAFAARADRMLAKPGMGFDEGYQIVYNEQARILARLRS